MGAKKKKKTKKSKSYPAKITQKKVPKKSDNPKIELPKGVKEEIWSWLENPSGWRKFAYSYIWVYGLIRVFITDLDLVFVTEYFNISGWTYSIYRFFIVSFIFLLFWFRVGNKQFWKTLFLFFLFPIYPVLFGFAKFSFWNLPASLVKKKYNYLLYTYLDNLISIIVKFKFTLLKAILFIVAFLILISYDSEFLYISIIIFVILQILHLHRRYNETYAPIKVLQIPISALGFDKHYVKGKIKSEATKIPIDEQKGVEISHMEYYVLISEFASVFNTNIQEVLSSRSYLKGFFFKALYSLLISIVFFGGINYALFKLNSANFQYSGAPMLFEFMYYSFFTIFPDGSDIEPITRLAKVVRASGVLVGVIINLLVFAVYFTVKSERYKENLERMNTWVVNYSLEINEFLMEKYKKDPAQGLTWLKSAGSELAEIIESLRKYIK